MLRSLFSWEKRNFIYKEGAEGPDFIDVAGCTDQACWPSRSTQRRCFHPRRFNKFTFFSASHHQLLSVTETKTQESLAPLRSGGPPDSSSAWNWTRVRTGLAWGWGQWQALKGGDGEAAWADRLCEVQFQNVPEQCPGHSKIRVLRPERVFSPV